MVIAGHRGAAGLAPENTLPSYRKALEPGVRLIELDVRLTRDGVPVCFHDDRLDRVTPERGPVAEWDWEPLSRVPVMPGAFGGAYPDAHIPTLGEVLRALPAECRFLVELKTEPLRPEELVRAALATVREAGAEGRCRFISFEQELLRLVRAAAPEAGLGVLVGGRGGAELLPRAREVGAEALHPHFSLVEPDLVREAQEGGFLLSTWTVNKADEVRRLAALGADEIATDFPDMALGAAEGGVAG